MKTPHSFEEEKRRAGLPIGSFALNAVSDVPPAAGQAAHTLALPLSVCDSHFARSVHKVTVVDAKCYVWLTAPKEDAAFIVRACNSHAALVAFARNVTTFGEDGPFACAGFYSLKQAARAALQAARE